MNEIVPRSPLPAVRLNARTQVYVSKSKSKNTMRGYAADLIDFQTWCLNHNMRAIPAVPQTVVDYLTDLADSGLSVSTIQRRVAAIAFTHRTNNLDDPTTDQAVRVLMQGIRRTLTTAPAQKSPITRDDLKVLLAHTTADLRGRRDRALLLIGFAGAFRRSELAALTLADVTFQPNGMYLRLRHSKTDQEGAGTTKHIPALENSPLCPVRALKAYLREAEIIDGAIFRKVDRWNHVGARAIDPDTVARIVKRLCQRAGMPVRDFAGHSLRSGFVTQATADGVDDWKIMRVTGHKSPAMLDRYNRDKGQGQESAIRRALGESK